MKDEWHIGTSWGPNDRGLVAERAGVKITVSWPADATGARIAAALDRMAHELRKEGA